MSKKFSGGGILNQSAPEKQVQSYSHNLSGSLKEDLSSQFSREYFGLNFLGKSYARFLANENASSWIAADTEHNHLPQNQNFKNLLIKGDNLEVLRHLKNAYANKIKMIYIDPPYNTLNGDFVYNDDRKLTPEQIAKIANLDKEDSERLFRFLSKEQSSHSAWCLFMYPRLKLARDLLRDDGVIFISIDDNEQAVLKLLLDEVFGEENFVTEFVWKCRNSLQHDEPLVSKQTERILFFCKNKSIWGKQNNLKLNRIRKPFDATEYDNPDNDPRGPWLSSGKTRNDGRPSYTVTSPSGKQFTKPWIPSPQEFAKWEKENLIWWGKNGDSIPRKKSFLKDFVGNAISDILFDEYTDEIVGDNKLRRTKQWEVGTTENGTKKLKELFGETLFDYPKPVTLIKYLIEISLNNVSGNLKDSEPQIVLDLFAGSGTTAHAVMDLNAKDNGNRQFILVQLDEKIDEKNKNQRTAYDFCKNELKSENPSIFDITKERIIRAANKIKSETNTTADLGFQIYELTENKRLLPRDELAEQEDLFNNLNAITDEQDLMAVLNAFKLYDGIELFRQPENVDLNGYVAYQFDEHLYLMQQNFTIQHLKALTEKIDSNKNFNPSKIVLLGQNFDSIEQRQAIENLQNFINKKSLSIRLIVRY